MSVPLKKYELVTDKAREWKGRQWVGDFLIVLRNDTEDLQLMFDVQGSDEDFIDIPRIDFGENSVVIEGAKEFQKVFLKHSALANGIIRVIIGRKDSTYTLRPADTLGKTPVIYNVTLTAADTEYPQTLPLGTKKFTLKERDGGAFRLAFTKGLVAAPTEPYFTILENQAYWEDDLLLSNKTLYFAGAGQQTIEIIAWT